MSTQEKLTSARAQLKVLRDLYISLTENYDQPRIELEMAQERVMSQEMWVVYLERQLEKGLIK